MRVDYWGCLGLAGNMTDALSYLEPLADRGDEVRLNLFYNTTSLLSVDEVYERLETTLPRESFRVEGFPSMQGLTRDPREKSLRILAAPQWISRGGRVDRLAHSPHLCKAIFPISEEKREIARRQGVDFFTPTRSLARVYSYDYVPRPLRTDVYRRYFKRSRKYEVVDAVVLNKNKRLDILDRLAESYRVKIAIIVMQKWQLEELSKLENLDYIINASKTELAKLYSSSRLLVHPAEHEQACCTLDEAMLCGCIPLLRAGASLSYREQGLGYEHYFTSEETLRAKIDTLLEASSSIHREIAERAYRAKSREFLVERWLEYVDRKWSSVTS